MDFNHFQSFDSGVDVIAQSAHIQPSVLKRRRPLMVSLCVWGMALWTAFCVYGTLHGLYRVSQLPLPTNEWAQAGQGMGFLLGMGIWAVAWFIPTVGLGIIALLTHALKTRAY